MLENYLETMLAINIKEGSVLHYSEVNRVYVIAYDLIKLLNQVYVLQLVENWLKGAHLVTAIVLKSQAYKLQSDAYIVYTRNCSTERDMSFSYAQSRLKAMVDDKSIVVCYKIYQISSLS